MVFSFKKLVFGLIAVLVIGVTTFLTLSSRSNLTVVSPQPSQTESSDTFSIQSSDASSPTVETSEVHSPDGKMTLIVETVTENENLTYSFFVSELPPKERKLIFETTLPVGSMMQASLNAWSPDNRYLFIKQGASGSMDYFVFKATGETFENGQAYINIRPLFVAKNTGNSLFDVTGWDSPTLLHLFTKTNSGEGGPSYWFEVTSEAIIQLASH